MSIPRVDAELIEAFFSPYSGKPAELGDGRLNGSDPTLLFVYCGNAAHFAYLGQRMAQLLESRGIDDACPNDIAQSILLEGAVIFAINNGWDGVNFYGFAPVPE
jgi:hypothetical protein